MIPVPIKILKLLITERENRMESDLKRQKAQEAQYDMSGTLSQEEGEDWEDVDDCLDDSKEYTFLSGTSFPLTVGIKEIRLL